MLFIKYSVFTDDTLLLSELWKVHTISLVKREQGCKVRMKVSQPPACVRKLHITNTGHKQQESSSEAVVCLAAALSFEKQFTENMCALSPT